MIMKRQLNVLLKEMDERLKYLMERVDGSTNEEMESYYTGKYCELDKVYKELKEILDNENKR